MASNSWLNPVTRLYRGIGRRTKKAYARLYSQPNYLFGSGTRTTIFPNGEREIWIKNADGTAVFAIKASDGPAGFSLSVRVPVGCLKTDSHVMTRPAYTTEIIEDVREVTICAYYQDAYAQQFRSWYKNDARDEHGNNTVPHPDTLGLEPRPYIQEAVDKIEAGEADHVQ